MNSLMKATVISLGNLQSRRYLFPGVRCDISCDGCRGIWNPPFFCQQTAFVHYAARRNGIKAWCGSQAAGLWADKLTATVWRFQYPVTLRFMTKTILFWACLAAASAWAQAIEKKKDPNYFPLLLKHWTPNKQLQSEMFFFSSDSRCLPLKRSCLQTIRMCVVGIGIYSRLLRAL